MKKLILTACRVAQFIARWIKLLVVAVAVVHGGCRSNEAHPERLRVDGYIYIESHIQADEFRPIAGSNEIRTCPYDYQWTMVKCVAVASGTEAVVWRCSNCSRCFIDVTANGAGLTVTAMEGGS